MLQQCSYTHMTFPASPLSVVAGVLQMNSLQRELMDSQELLESKNFEVTQMQRRLEELAHRLTDKNSSLDAHKQVRQGLQHWCTHHMC